MAKVSLTDLKKPTGLLPTGKSAGRVWEREPSEFAKGVTLTHLTPRADDKIRCEDYTGTNDALIKAGLCRADQLPGQPGNGVGSCTYAPDGTRIIGGGKRAQAGTLKILKRGGHNFTCRLHVALTGDEQIYLEKEIEDETPKERASYVRPTVITQDASGRSTLRHFQNSPYQRHDFVVHTLYDWGESWSGTQAQLQSIGIGVDVDYPRKKLGKRHLLTTNLQGEKIKITEWERGLFHAEFVYSEHKKLIGREAPIEFAPGVLLVRHQPRNDHLRCQDEYRGSGDALIACGLVSAEQLPGTQGKGKTMRSFYSDGRIKPPGTPTHGEPGDWKIEKRSGGFRILVEALRTKQEVELWKRKYANQEVENKKACAIVRLNRNRTLDGVSSQGFAGSRALPPGWRIIVNRDFHDHAASN